jgi:hypothetical protein
MEFPDLLELDDEVVPFTSPMSNILQQIQNTRGRGRGLFAFFAQIFVQKFKSKIRR